MRLFAAAFLVLTACQGLAQESRVESRTLETGFLTRQTYSRWSDSLGLAQDAIGTRIAAGNEIGGGLVSPEELGEILRRDVPGVTIAYDLGRLVAKGPPAALDAVDAWLVRARARHGRRLIIDAAIVLAPPGAADVRGGKVLQSFRMSTSPGQNVVAERLRQQSYLRDHDVQIGTAATALDPIIDVLSTGTRIQLLPHIDPVGDGVLFEVRAETAALEAMEERTLKMLRIEPATPQENAPVQAKPWEAMVQLPKIALDVVRCEVRGRVGETIVAASASRADGTWALLLTPSFSEPAPAAEPGTRIYDVRGITGKVQDWAAGRPWLASPQRGGGGPLTGATFTLDEPKAGYGEETLKDDVRAVVDAPGTPDDKSAVERTSCDAFTIRAGHAAAEKVLAEAFRRETRTVSTEAAIVAFKAREAWAKILGADRSTEEAMAPLFEAARKGGDVRFVGSISATGRIGQSVYVTSGRQRAYVQDYEPQVSTLASQADPIIGILVTGLGLQVRPEPSDGAGGMALDLRCWSLTGDVADDKAVSTGIGPVQRATIEGPRWDLDIVCAPKHWTLAAVESRDGEEWALFVRVK